jgi:sugar (pentulose or hexulose) kinase
LGLAFAHRLYKGSKDKAGARPNYIAGVTATSMREGIVLYDKQKHAIWACPNADARSKGDVEEMIKVGLAEAIYRISDDWLNILTDRSDIRFFHGETR